MRFALHQVAEVVRDAHSFQFERGGSTGNCISFLRAAGAWQLRSRLGPRLSWKRQERLTVILLSFKRVRNIEAIVRSLARLDCVERILVSNNNPAHRIRDWVRVREPRLTLLDQPAETFCGIRFVLARQQPGDFFLAIDDDVFLQPDQVQGLFEALLESPERVHGVHGEVFEAVRSRDWGHPVEGSTEEVDVVNQVYAFTRAHVDELFRVAEAVGEDVVDCIGDDMLLSFSGRARPLCHDLGPVLRCLSASRERVATFRTLPDFPGRRADLLHALRRLKPELAAAAV